MAPRKGNRKTKGRGSTNKRKRNNVQQNPSKKLKTSATSCPCAKVKIVSSITPRKSPRDPNEYRVIQLSTGLTVALISRKDPPRDGATPSDSAFSQGSSSAVVGPFSWAFKPECHFIEPVALPLGCTTTTPPTAIPHRATRNTRHTSIAVVVNVGSLDFPNREGLAHFTEHMVHYGSKKFPNEDSMHVLVANFGVYNATTMQHTTSYYNQVPDSILEKNLAMFAEMLTQPLFPLEVLNREVNAVDNEYYLGLPHWRKFQLESHVSIKGSEHPLKRFTCGSLETLGNGRDGAKVQSEMKDFHKKNYVAPAMTLSINSTKSLDELEELVLRHFPHFLQGDRSIYAKTPEGKTPPLVLQGSQHVFLQGLSPRAELSMIWYLPASLSTQGRVIPFIVRMLSDSSEASLCHHLRREGLIWFMAPIQNGTRYATLMEIVFMLTEKGSQNVSQIVQATFNYIRVLRNVPEREMKRAFDEMKLQILKEYHYGSQTCSLETTKDFAMRLQYLGETSNLVSSESWMDSQLNYKDVQQALALLESEDTTLIETLSKKDKDKLATLGEVKTAPYSNAKYVVKPWKKELPSASPSRRDGSGDSAPNFALIPPNRYLDFDLFKGVRCPHNYGDIKQQQLSWPSSPAQNRVDSIPKILGNHLGHSSFSHDPFFSRMDLQFISSVSRIPSRRNCALSWLHGFTVKQKAAVHHSAFANAGFGVLINAGHPLTLSLRGFSCQMEKAMNTLISCVFEQPVTHSAFFLAKEQLNAELGNFLSNNHPAMSINFLNCTIFDKVSLDIDFLGILEELTLQDLNTYIRAFRQSTFASLNLSGNIPVKSFNTIASHLERMPFAPAVDRDVGLYVDNPLSFKQNFYCPGERCIRVKALNSNMYTNCVTNSYFLGPCNTDPWQDTLFIAGVSFMGCQAFMDLRTRQQLGYSVFVNTAHVQYQTRSPMQMFSISVLSTARKFTVCELDQKMDQFLAEYGEYVRTIPTEMFQTKLTMLGILEAVTQDEVADWFESRFKADFGKLDIKWKCLRAGIKKISVQVLSGNEDALPKACDCQICSGIEHWKNGYSEGLGSQFQFAVGKDAAKKYFVSPFNY